MTTLCRKLMLSVYMLLGLSGCLGSLVSTSSPPRYFQISYSYKPEKCIGKIGGTLKIWPFSASAPYDRDEMIVLDSFRQVHFSPLYRWVSFPGNMISDMLLRDMSRSTLFNQVVTAGNSAETGLEMGGHVYEFAWRQEAGSGHAVLDVEISL